MPRRATKLHIFLASCTIVGFSICIGAVAGLQACEKGGAMETLAPQAGQAQAHPVRARAAPQPSSAPAAQQAQPGARDGWTNWITTATSKVSEALSMAVNSSQSDSRKPKLAKAASKGSETKGSEASPDVSAAFVQDLVSQGVAAAMQVMGQAADGRFKAVEADVAEQREDIGKIQEGMQELYDNKIDIDEYRAVQKSLADLTASEEARRKEYERMREESLVALAEMKAVTASASSAGSAPPGLPGGRISMAPSYANSTSPRRNSPPFEERVDSILAGFAEGMSEEQLLETARAALLSVGVGDNLHEGLTPNRRNTCVFITFKEAGGLRLACGKVRRANVAGGPGRRVWMDARRTREENRPGRTVHKAAEALTDLNTTILREGKQVPFATETLFKDMKRFAIKNVERGEVLCF